MTRYLSVTELHRLLGVSRATAYQLVKRSDFPSIRIGKRVVISEDGLREWLERGGTQQREA